MTPDRDAGREVAPLDTKPVDRTGMLDVGAAAAYLGVTEAFVRRLVLERRVRYFKLGKFVRLRTDALDAFIEAGRHEPVAPWVHTRSTLLSATTRSATQPPKPGRQAGGSASPQQRRTRR